MKGEEYQRMKDREIRLGEEKKDKRHYHREYHKKARAPKHMKELRKKAGLDW